MAIVPADRIGDRQRVQPRMNGNGFGPVNNVQSERRSEPNRVAPSDRQQPPAPLSRTLLQDPVENVRPAARDVGDAGARERPVGRASSMAAQQVAPLVAERPPPAVPPVSWCSINVSSYLVFIRFFLS